MENEKKLNEIRKNLDNMDFFTVGIAKELAGKKVQVWHPGYGGQDGTMAFVVGDVVSEMEYVRNREKDYKSDKFANRAEEWESWMTPSQIAERENKLLLLDAEGNYTYLYTYKEGLDADVFCCGDDGRWCKYMEVE